MKKGWISIHRKIQDCWIWEGKEPFDRRSAWIDLLLMVNHSDAKILFNGKLTTVKRGQYITSIRKLSERWKWSYDKTARFLKLLESDGMLQKESDKNRTLLTIVNYGFYQDDTCTENALTSEQTGHSQVNSPYTDRAPTSEQSVHRQVTNNNDNNENNENNENNDNNENNIITVSKETVCQTDVRLILDAWNELEAFGVKPVSRVTNTSKRYQSLVARMREYNTADILLAIEKIKESDFLQGKSKQGWQITFDWFVLPNNFPKVLEGNYSNSKQEQSQSFRNSEIDWSKV